MPRHKLAAPSSGHRFNLGHHTLPGRPQAPRLLQQGTSLAGVLSTPHPHSALNPTGRRLQHQPPAAAALTTSEGHSCTSTMTQSTGTEVLVTEQSSGGHTASCKSNGPTHKVISYNHEEHFQDICDICKDVYGGGDYMPRMLPEYCQDGNTLLLVAVTPHGDGSRVDAIVGATVRDDLIFLFGLRVRVDARGGGLGRLVMAELCSQAKQVFGSRPDCRHMATITITINKPAQKIILGELPGPHQVLTMWPGNDDLHDYESEMGWPQNQATAEGKRLLESVPGALAALRADAEACRLVGAWQQADNTAQVSAALKDIRQAHLQQHLTLHKSFTSDQDNGGMEEEEEEEEEIGVEQLGADWLPGFFDMFPANGEWAEQQVQEGRVWLLYSKPEQNGVAGAQQGGANAASGQQGTVSGSSGIQGRATGGTEPQGIAGAGDGNGVGGSGKALGVLLLYKSLESRRWTAGIVALDSSAAHSAILKADTLQPHFVSFLDYGCLYGQASLTRQGAVPDQAPPGDLLQGMSDLIHPPAPALCLTARDPRLLLVYGMKLA